MQLDLKFIGQLIGVCSFAIVTCFWLYAFKERIAFAWIRFKYKRDNCTKCKARRCNLFGHKFEELQVGINDDIISTCRRCGDKLCARKVLLSLAAVFYNMNLLFRAIFAVYLLILHRNTATIVGFGRSPMLASLRGEDQ